MESGKITDRQLGSIILVGLFILRGLPHSSQNDIQSFRKNLVQNKKQK